MHKTLQIGVMGSMADVTLGTKEKEIAQQLGAEIAKAGATLVFGFEGDFDSFSTMAAREAEIKGGKTIAFSWGSSKTDMGELDSIRVVTGQTRGGGREFSLILSCDAIICIGGGSGTLMEIAMAYQAGIPMVVLKGTGGWSDQLTDKYLDDRKRMKILAADNPKEAIKIVSKILNTTPTNQ